MESQKNEKAASLIALVDFMDLFLVKLIASPRIDY